MTDDNIPEYLKALKEESLTESHDNFGPEDVVWVGSDGDIDPDELVAIEGREFHTALFQVLRALVAGHQPDLSPEELARVTKVIQNKIVGKAKDGNSEYDDGPLLMEIAHRYHNELYQAGKWPSGTVPLKPIVRCVVQEFGQAHRGQKWPNEESLISKLSRNFKKDRDLWLSRVTTDDPYFAPERFEEVKTIRKALSLLARVGVLVDIEKIRATTRPDKASGAQPI